ncbi:MAG: porin family protein [Acidobacteriia bacterium]|nr:porin family protein [Terriglobia bacterium]
MALQRSWVAVLLAMALLAAHAAAQQKNEVAVVVGRIFVDGQKVPNTNFFNNTVNFGEGLTFEGSYGRRIKGGEFAALTFEVPVLFTPDQQLNYGINTIPESYKAFFVTPSLRASIFAANAVSPWVSFGGGFGHFSESSTLVFGGPNPGKTGTTTGVFQIGVGADVRIWKNFSLRGEWRDYSSGVPQLNVNTGKSRQSNYFVGGGVVWHF